MIDFTKKIVISGRDVQHIDSIEYIGKFSENCDFPHIIACYYKGDLHPWVYLVNDMGEISGYPSRQIENFPKKLDFTKDLQITLVDDYGHKIVKPVYYILYFSSDEQELRKYDRLIHYRNLDDDLILTSCDDRGNVFKVAEWAAIVTNK